LLWELLHSTLYETVHGIPLKKYVSLIIIASVKDGMWILFLYLISVSLFKNIFIFLNNYQLAFFLFSTIAFSFLDEKISLKLNRWKYTKNMPKFFGVGITPLLELAITGILTFSYVFLNIRI
jgi:hypothetical protein